MTLRSNLRALGWVASELFDAFWPGQAVRCALDRDYSRAVTRAGYAHDAEEALNEYEAENDGLDGYYYYEAVSPDGYYGYAEPNLGHSPRAQCKWCGGVETPDHDCGREYRIGRDIKVGEKYCALCGVQLGEDYHTCPVLAAEALQLKNFAGAAASLADGCLSGDLPHEPQEPSVREDKQQGNSSSLSRPAGPQQDLSSAASASTGGCPAGVESPAPPAGVDPPSRTSPKGDGEGPAGDRGIRSSAPAGHPNSSTPQLK